MNLSTFEAFKRLKMSDVGIPVEGETLRKCQRVILSVAEDVIRVCEEKKIWYELGGGTALGAVRHGGFIPWDDDIDINILGKDLERLGHAINEKYGDKYSYMTYAVPEYGLPMGKVMLNGTIYRDRESCGSKDCGFFIDIFPIENVPDNVILRKIHGSLCMCFGGLLSCRKFYKNRKFLMEIAEKNPEVKKVIKTKINIGRMISFISLRNWAVLTDKVYGMCKNEKSVYVTIPSSRKHYFKGMAKRSIMINTSSVEFEGHKWMVAANYDAYLKRLYGDGYMTIPPEEKREHHILLELKFPEKI